MGRAAKDDAHAPFPPKSSEHFYHTQREATSLKLPTLRIHMYVNLGRSNGLITCNFNQNIINNKIKPTSLNPWIFLFVCRKIKFISTGINSYGWSLRMLSFHSYRLPVNKLLIKILYNDRNRKRALTIEKLRLFRDISAYCATSPGSRITAGSSFVCSTPAIIHFNAPAAISPHSSC